MSFEWASRVGSTVRYRYRIYPTAQQVNMLARTFGCARVVFNDALVERERAQRAGERLSDTEVQRRVVTLAKATPEREWLGEVASVAVVQACQDARVAYRNWFDSLSGKRKGRKAGRPRFKRKHGRQSFRLTRNGFALKPNGRLYVAKVGDVRVRWSRDLPSEPSSVTITRDGDGRFYASFVVQRTTDPQAPSDAAVGVDLGLAHFATFSTGEKVDNPRFLRGAARRLARAQRQLSRKQKGSKNRKKARRRVAVAHRKVRDKRADHAHKLARRLIDENQVVAVETLSVAGLARTRLAKSIADAGWSQFVRLLDEKAAQHGRQVVHIDRFEPTSQVCSACGVKDGPKPLSVRTWTCRACGVEHDRDVNAALNVLVAAGLAETLTACGEGSAGRQNVVGGTALSEAGTRRSAA